MIQPVYIHDEFEAIVKSVSNKMIAYLQTQDANITAVHYRYGHPLEIKSILKGYDQGDTTRFQKYPLIMFFLDTEVQRGIYPGVYGEYNIHLAIINECLSPTQNAAERDETNFKPILTPIYLELMAEIALRGDLFMLPFAETVPHKVTNRYYWGRSGLWGNTSNVFYDWVDAVEIQNLKLKVNTNYCPKPAI